MFEKTLEIHLAAQLPKHPEIAQSYNNLANVLALKNTNDKSPRAMHTKDLHLHSIGEQYHVEYNFVDATKYHQDAFRIRLQHFYTEERSRFNYERQKHRFALL
ncbi:unnamed protein product [Rotaria socialis]|uniref:Uncharacterized protein n=1 Tax=Rotaria socialis TaxID=392032 RepID=A0A820TRS3_9BILA|nr:unnamed protein product [Rotaria socialis]CAF4735722.1 unnamed protein product [Rotaria socialis]